MEEARKVSTPASVINSLKSNTGLGIFTLPFMLHAAGFLPGLFLLVVCMSISVQCCLRLVRCKNQMRNSKGSARDVIELGSVANPNRSAGTTTSFDITSESDQLALQGSHGEHSSHSGVYTDVAEHYLGWYGRQIALWSLVIGNFGSYVAYIVFLKKNMHAFFPNAFGNNAFLSESIWVVLMSPFIVAFQFLRDLRALTPVNSFSLFALICTVVLVVHDASSDFTANQMGQLFGQGVRWNSIGLAFGIISFMNEGLMGMCLPIESSMRIRQDYSFVLHSSMAMFVGIYVLFGLAACLHYEDPQSTITSNFPTNVMHQIVIIFGCCQLLFTVPLVCYVVNTLLETEFTTWFEHRNSLRVVLALMSCILAISVEQLADFLALVGCVGNSCNIFILPNLCFLFGLSSELTQRERISAIMILVVGGLATICGICATVSDMSGQ